MCTKINRLFSIKRLILNTLPIIIEWQSVPTPNQHWNDKRSQRIILNTWPECFDTNIYHNFLNYKITFVNLQHALRNSNINLKYYKLRYHFHFNNSEFCGKKYTIIKCNYRQMLPMNIVFNLLNWIEQKGMPFDHDFC